MRKAKVDESSRVLPPMRPALSEEAREGQLISLAMDLVEQRLRDGTATSQETTHFLKMGSMRERLEREKLRNENILLQAKKVALESQAHMEQIYAEALQAMKLYSGSGSSAEEDYDHDERRF